MIVPTKAACETLNAKILALLEKFQQRGRVVKTITKLSGRSTFH